MVKLNDNELLRHYIEKYELGAIFQTDMSRFMSLYKYDRGEGICKTGDEMQNIYFNVMGKLKIYTMRENGKSLLLRFNKPLSILGDVELINKHNVKCYVDSLTDSILIGISFEDIKKHAYDDSLFLRFVIRHLSHKLYTISNATSLNMLYPLENRFASYLLSVSSDENNSRIDELRTNKLTELANLLGSSYRHLCRVINELEASEVIRSEARKIVIVDYAKLKELAGENIYE